MENQDKFEKYSWELIADYFKTEGIIRHHLDSFDRFLYHSIQKVIDNEPEIEVNGSKVKRIYKFGEVYVSNPAIFDDDRNKKVIYPQEARDADLTYESPLFIDIKETVEEGGIVTEEKLHKRIMIAKIPMMVNCSLCNLNDMTLKEKIAKGECEFDKGGYFVIKGKERVLVGQLNSLYNTVFVSKQKPKERFLYIAEMRSMSEETGHSVLIQCKILNDERNIVFSLPYIKEAILVGIVFKALGCVDYEEMFNYINLKGKKYDRIRKNIERDSYFIESQEEALKYIGQYSIHSLKEDKRVDYANQVVENELFPHLGIVSTTKEKLLMLGKMVNKLINTFMGFRAEDDKDNYIYKRVQMSGVLCADLFRTLYKRYLKTLQMQLEKKKFNPDIINVISRVNSITTGMRQAFATGNWGIQKTSYVRTGVSQVLSRLTFGATLSHLRRLAIPIGKEGKNTKIRQIHQSQIMYICPHESPEGQSVGIVLNLAMLTQVSRNIPSTFVREIINKSSNLICIEDVKNFDKTIVLLNGKIIGSTENYIDFIKDVKQYKNFGMLDKQISVTYNRIDNEVKVFCDEGRLIRPVYNLKNNDIELDFENKSWKHLVDNDKIIFIDNNEAAESVIAMEYDELKKFKCNYLEIAPAMMLGVMASIIPFSNHSQAPRICYQSAMGKQALGIHSLAHNLRSDTSSYVMDYPQKPLVSTLPSRMMGFDDMPSGVNAIVAIMCYTGFNQEDSIIMNKSSVERGLFGVTAYRTVVFNEKKKLVFGVSEHICVPSNEIKKKSYNYSLLDSSGIVKKGSYVSIGDVLVGKIKTKQQKNKFDEKTDCSFVAKSVDETGFVDRIIISETNGQKLVKITLRKVKTPEVGDKFAARSAQKATVGIMLPQEDMPFTQDGITPDIIMNAHALPSRMTLNQLMECVLGKKVCMDGKFGDATPFTKNGDDVSNLLCENLKKFGFEKTGTEVMYSGFTGEPLEARVFIGPTYYQRLKHMVSNKMHSRATGHVTTLLRQPLEGRSREGGLRFGEMERDCMISHGCARFLRERLFDQSDPYYVNICNSCKNLSTTPTLCKGCNNDKITTTNLPYAAKLLFQELNSMGIKILINPKE